MMMWVKLEQEELVQQPSSMNRKRNKIIEFSLAGIFLIALLSIGIPSVISNIEKSKYEASYLEAKSFYEEYLEVNDLTSLEDGTYLYYNDGHLYWVIDSNGNIQEDLDKNPMTPLKEGD